MGILLLCMSVDHKLRYPAEQSELLTAESSHQPSHLVSSTIYCTFTSSHSEGADDECVKSGQKSGLQITSDRHVP